MARFILAWEQGGGLGHALPLSQLACALLARGHQVDLVWREPSKAPLLLGEAWQHPNLRLWAAPHWRGLNGPGMPTPPRSYADLLCLCGHLDQPAITALLKAWLDLLRTLQADVLVADYAPVALLAARSLPGLRTAQVGNGYFQPPRTSPLPSFRFWDLQAPSPAFEEAVLATCQAAQQACGVAPAHQIQQVADLLHTDVDALQTWPTLHTYGPQAAPGQHFAGPLPTPDIGAQPQWPTGASQRRVLAYLSASHPSIDTIMDTLVEAGAPTLLILSGATPALAERAAAHAHIRLMPGLVAMQAALAQADAVVCQGNSGTVMATLMAGLPLLMFPGHTEQWITAYRACEMQVGVALQPEEICTHGVLALQAVLDDAHFRSHAQAVAQAHPPSAAQTNLDALCALLEGP